MHWTDLLQQFQAGFTTPSRISAHNHTSDKRLLERILGGSNLDGPAWICRDPAGQAPAANLGHVKIERVNSFALEHYGRVHIGSVNISA